MINTLQDFIDGAAAWIVEGGSLAIRFLAFHNEGEACVMDASLDFGPRTIPADNDFVVKTENLIAGNKTWPSLSRSSALSIVKAAVGGLIEIDGIALRLNGVEPTGHYSESLQRDRWAGDLHLQISGEAWREPITPSQLMKEDNSLRRSTPPFDGTSELVKWLGLNDPRSTLQRPAISLRIRMPVDLIYSPSALASDCLKLSLIAHKRCDLKKVSIAVRAHPGNGLTTRRQVGSLVKWRRGTDGFKDGSLTVHLKAAESALVMITYAGHLARRQWFIDPDKATNLRLLALQTFDRELRQLRQALLESTDATRFEQGVASLLFLLGFSPAPVLETQAPDIIVMSPAGAIAIVECTTRIADFAAKVGKLVDRRQALLAQLEANGKAMRVLAFLVTSQPRAQVAAEHERLQALSILLLSREDIVEGLDQTRLPRDPDAVLDEAARQLSAASLG